MKKKIEIILSGFGGQGVLLAGNLLALAGMYQGYNVTFLPVYGPEMRGGTCHCTVILSEKEIASPLVLQPTYLILLNFPSFLKFLPRLKEGGLALVNSDLVNPKDIKDYSEFTNHKKLVFLPLNTLAEEIGAPLTLNICAIGAFNALLKIFPHEIFEKALKELLGHTKAHLLEINLKAYQKGWEKISLLEENENSSSKG